MGMEEIPVFVTPTTGDWSPLLASEHTHDTYTHTDTYL